VENPEGAFFQVGQFVHEYDGPVKGETRHQESNDLGNGKVGFPNRQDKSGPAQEVVKKEIDPIDPGIGVKKVATDPFGVGHGKLGRIGFHFAPRVVKVTDFYIPAWEKSIWDGPQFAEMRDFRGSFALSLAGGRVKVTARLGEGRLQYP
jgi:hypothetical protein